MRFEVLGEVRVRGRDGDAHRLPSTRQRVLLATLLLQPDTPVPADHLVATAWSPSLPTDPYRSLRAHIYRLRRWLRRLTAPYPQTTVLTAGDGYVAVLGPDTRDVDEFRRRVGQARRARGDEALRYYRAALGLWRGPALADLRGTPLEPVAARLDHERDAAVAEFAARALAEGPDTPVDVLVRWVTEFPAEEGVGAVVMAALYRAGRRPDALALFDALVHAGGGRPAGEGLRRVHRAVLLDLAHDPVLERPAGTPVEVTAAHPGAQDRPTVPDRPDRPPPPDVRLPRSCPGFHGRRAAIRQATAARGAGSRLLGILGMAGIGKTTLAVRLAHDWADAYPDGQFLVDLGGFSPAPVDPADALARLLRALGVAADRIPSDVDERAALYRSVLAHRRCLLVLDNARDEAHVRPLVPGGATSLAVVTSRTTLSGLAGLAPVRLEVPAVTEALALLDRIVPATGADRPARRRLVELCGRLPLAIRIAGTAINHSGQSTVDSYVTRLRGELDRLAVLDGQGDGVRAAFDLSYRALSVEDRALLRSFGRLPGVPRDAALTAAVTGRPLTAVAAGLERLVDVNLVETDDADRYRVHDLVALFAAERARAEDGVEAAATAERAGLTWLLATGLAAAVRANPTMVRLPPLVVPDPDRFADRTDALAWLDAQRPTLVAAIRAAAAAGHPDLAVHLADALRGYFYLRRCTAEWLDAAHVGLACAARTDDPRHRAAMHASLGLALSVAARYQESLARYGDALRACDAERWPEGVASVLGNLGAVHDQLGDLGAAHRHYDHALALNRSRGNRAGVAVRLGNLGGIHRYRGEFDKASYSYQAAMAAYAETGSTDGQALMLVNLGGIALDQGDPATAAANARQALGLYRESGSRLGRCLALMLSSAAEGESGCPEESLRLAVEALALARPLGDPRLEVDALNAVGAAETRLGRRGPARDHHDDAARLAAAIGFQSGRIEALIGLAAATGRIAPEPPGGLADDPAGAERAGETALAAARSLGYRLLARRALVVLARVRTMDPGRAARIDRQREIA